MASMVVVVKLALVTQLEEEHLERSAMSLRERWSVRGTGTHLADVSRNGGIAVIAVITGVCLALLISAAVVVRLNGRWKEPGAVGRALRWFGVAGIVGIAVAVLPATWSDNEGATAYLLAVPLVAAVAVAVADITGRAVGTVTAVAAMVVLVWGLLLGLGQGGYFLFPALVLVVAVLASVGPRDRATPSPGSAGPGR